jgi:hypothetical protein
MLLHGRRCGTCDGSGVKPGTTASTCSACGGAGQQVSAVRTPLGMFQQVRIPSNANTDFRIYAVSGAFVQQAMAGEEVNRRCKCE